VTTSTNAPVVPAAQQQSAAKEVEIPVTTTTVAPKAAPVSAAPAATGDDEHGQATWYAAAPAGKCASPTLPFGTVLTVTNVGTGASTTCTVDDREEAGYPRVVDMSPSGFAQLASPSQGVVDVTISW
jgi:rare lipoprotein A